MKRSFLEELGIEKSIVDKIMQENGRDINNAKNTSGSEELRRQVSDLEAQIENMKVLHKSELESVIIEGAVKNALARANARTEKAVKALIDTELITVNDKGEVTGLEEQLERLVNSEDTAYLFENREISGAAIGESGREPEVDFGSMNYTQMCEYMQRGLPQSV